MKFGYLVLVGYLLFLNCAQAADITSEHKELCKAFSSGDQLETPIVHYRIEYTPEMRKPLKANFGDFGDNRFPGMAYAVGARAEIIQCKKGYAISFFSELFVERLDILNAKMEKIGETSISFVNLIGNFSSVERRLPSSSLMFFTGSTFGARGPYWTYGLRAVLQPDVCVIPKIYLQSYGQIRESLGRLPFWPHTEVGPWEKLLSSKVDTLTPQDCPFGGLPD